MAENRRYRGLLIGNATFPRDPHALPALDGPLDDIAQMRQVLTDPQVGLFDSADLEALPDHGVQGLREKVDELFATATRGDILLLYYSGHGQLDERGTLYLCAKDTRTAGLRATALSAIELNNIIDGSPASSTVIILDCCYSGAFKGTATAAPVAGRGRYVLTSSRSTQLARAADRPGQPSPFTGQLVRALRTAQPGKAAGHLTVVEIYRQVHHWMTADAVIAPQLRFAGEGDVALARRPPPPPRRTEPSSTADPDSEPGMGPAERRATHSTVPPSDPPRSPQRVTTKRLGYAAAVAALALVAGSLLWIAPWSHSTETEPFTLDGRYEGHANNDKNDVATVTFHPGKVGENIGTISWPGLECKGVLNLASINGAKGFFNESMTEKKSNFCSDLEGIDFVIIKGEVHLKWRKYPSRTAVLSPSE